MGVSTGVAMEFRKSSAGASAMKIAGVLRATGVTPKKMFCHG
jgi:hypothetical protein